MIALIISALLSHAAFARMGDGELGPPLPPPCDMNQVNSCRESERVAGLNSRAAGEALDPKLNALAPLLSRLQADRDQAQRRVADVLEEEILIKEEITYLARGEEPMAKEILPGFAAEEDLFGLTESEKNWQERYPAERAQALNTQLGEAPSQEKEYRTQYQEISTKFDSLNGQFQSLQSQKANLFAEATSHANMSNTGCFQRICPR
jgi:hypothetical protein